MLQLPIGNMVDPPRRGCTERLFSRLSLVRLACYCYLLLLGCLLRAASGQMARDLCEADLCKRVEGSVTNRSSGLFLFSGNASACLSTQQQQSPVVSWS